MNTDCPPKKSFDNHNVRYGKKMKTTTATKKSNAMKSKHQTPENPGSRLGGGARPGRWFGGGSDCGGGTGVWQGGRGRGPPDSAPALGWRKTFEVFEGKLVNGEKERQVRLEGVEALTPLAQGAHEGVNIYLEYRD